MTNREKLSVIQGNVQLADRLAVWLRSLGVERTEVAADFADTVAAAVFIEREINEMMKLDPHDPLSADMVLSQLGRMRAWLFDEIKFHVGELEREWPALEARVLDLCPPDPDS
jgi:hypothetical protein